jgi:hypothetical protein
MLYNPDLPFDVVVEKLKVFDRLRLGPAYSGFRPSTILREGYVPQKRGQGDDEYYNTYELERPVGPHNRFPGTGHHRNNCTFPLCAKYDKILLMILSTISVNALQTVLLRCDDNN